MNNRLKKFVKKSSVKVPVMVACGMVFVLFIIHYSLFTANAQNFVGPTQSAGVGQGAIGVDSSNNLAIGTSTPQSDTKLLIVGTSTTGGYFAIKVLDMNRGPLFVVRSDGSVSIGGGYLQSNQSGATTTISGVGTAPMNGSLFVNGPIMTSFDLRANGLIVGPIGTSTQQSFGNIYASNNITAGGTLTAANYTGTINSGNISSGAFGSNTGGGNYSFPANVGIGSTIQDYGKLDVTVSPSAYAAALGLGSRTNVAEGDSTGISFKTKISLGGGIYENARIAAITTGVTSSVYGSLAFYTMNATTLGERMRIDNTGNVGIGIAVPVAKLDVRGVGLFVNTGAAELTFGSSGTNYPIFYDTGATGSNGGIALGGALTVTGTPSSATMFWNVNNGNVGIGTGTPLATGGLTIAKSAPASITTANNFLQLGNNNYGIGYFTIGFGYVVTETYMPAYMGYVSTDTSGVTKGALIFGTRDAVTDILPTERMRINSAGNVGIGTTAPSSTLTVAGAIRTTSVGVIFPDNTTQSTAYAGGTQTIVAGNVSAGAFGSNTGNGNYSFPASLSVGTSTAPTGGIATFMGNVGIGTTGPTQGKLVVSGGTANSIATIAISAVGSANAVNIGDDGTDAVIGPGNSATKFHILSRAAGVYSRALTVDSAGNVGIGTTGPTKLLTLKSAVTSGVNFLQTIGGSQYTAGTAYGLAFDPEGIGSRNKIAIVAEGDNNGWSHGKLHILMNSASDASEATLSDAKVTFLKNGNVGIGTISPSSTLHVVGTASFSQPVIVGTPTATGHAATKSYVDSTVGGSIGGTAANALACSGDSVCDMSGANLNGGSITGVNKLTVTTIDPLYSINGVKYSTYAASFAGGVKEEFTGKAKLARDYNYNNDDDKQNWSSLWSYVIDFDKVEVGSDLWVWYKAIDFSKDSVEAIATPYGQSANIWYEIQVSSAKIIFHGDKPAEFSFRLTGKRFDWQNWPTLAPNQNEKASLIINN